MTPTKPRYPLLSDNEMDDRASAQMAKGFEWLRQQRQRASSPQDTNKPNNESRGFMLALMRLLRASRNHL